MSHFTVMVIGDDIESQLAPFCEHEEGGSEYMVFNDCTEEVMDDWENKTSKAWYPENNVEATPEQLEKLRNGDPVTLEVRTGFALDKFEVGLKYRAYYRRNKDFDEVYVEATFVGDGLMTVTQIDPPEDVPLKDQYKDLDAFVEDWHGYQKVDGKYGYYHNPNAKWDWYQIGGRWTGFFKGKFGAEGVAGTGGLQTEPAPAGYFDSLRKKDIDFQSMYDEARDKALDEFEQFIKYFVDVLDPKEIPSWNKIREAHGENIDDARDEYKSTDFNQRLTEINREECKYLSNWRWAGDITEYFCGFDKDTFVQKRIDESIQTFAVLKDGEWYEKGEMGWFACVHNENDNWDGEFKKMFAELDDEELITIVDCHI